MESTWRICVVVPVYNHGLTVRDVVRGARQAFDVIAVNDGSTDATAAVLAAEKDIVVVTLKTNEGKAAALTRGFGEARELGFTHAITIDADGQHPVDALDTFAALSRRFPKACIIGVRNLRVERAPLLRRVSNAMSNLFFKLETGLSLRDTQCGFRVYPLERIAALPVRSAKYAYELEVMVRAAWAGMELIPCAVRTDYSAPTSRLSHFHPLHDFFRVARIHLQLSWERLLPGRAMHEKPKC
jgi:glycosyltransferase involved in cell wall biosynthesis